MVEVQLTDTSEREVQSEQITNEWREEVGTIPGGPRVRTGRDPVACAQHVEAVAVERQEPVGLGSIADPRREIPPWTY